MLKIRDTSTVPPETWRYPVAATGFTVSTRNYCALFGLIKDHCEANKIEVPTDQEIIDYLCQNLHVPCVDVTDSGNVPLINKMGLPFVAPKSTCCKSGNTAPVEDESF